MHLGSVPAGWPRKMMLSWQQEQREVFACKVVCHVELVGPKVAGRHCQFVCVDPVQLAEGVPMSVSDWLEMVFSQW